MGGAFSAQDQKWMRRALAAAEKGRGTTRPNPVVGAVVVEPRPDGDRLLAVGYHRRAGGDHAEVAALRKLGFQAPGATLYVTLEPCCHQGRTGPCTEVVLKSGVRRVVVGCRDRNPRVNGRGLELLRQAGLQVDEGCLEALCFDQNRAFFTWVGQGRPFITLKAAVTLDGFLAGKDGVSAWITGEEARRVAHQIRAQHDAVLVGAGTVLQDDPRLTVRLPDGPFSQAAPLRVVLDGRWRTPPSARLFKEGPAPLVIGAAPGPKTAAAARLRALERAGAQVLPLPSRAKGTAARGASRGAAPPGSLPLKAVLKALAAREIQALMVEGGAQVHGAFVDARLVDRVALFVAPCLLGAGLPMAAGRGWPLARGLRLGPLKAQPVGDDILLTADALDGDAVPPSPAPGR